MMSGRVLGPLRQPIHGGEGEGGAAVAFGLEQVGIDDGAHDHLALVFAAA